MGDIITEQLGDDKFIEQQQSPTFCLTSVNLCVMLIRELEKGEDW